MRIALLDLSHETYGVHNNLVPLGIGLIATYTRKKVDLKLDTKLFREIIMVITF